MATHYQRGPVLMTGKTKAVYQVEGDPSLAILDSKDHVTKNDDPDQTITLEGKGGWSTATTCRVFELLRDAGLPVAYKEQLSATTFLAPACKMIPLECIARRRGVGSYRKRNPHIPDGQRFHSLVTELFLKTTRGSFRRFGTDETMEVMPPNAANKDNRPDDDPLILDAHATTWQLGHPKYPVYDSSARIKTAISPVYVLPEGITVAMLDGFTRKAFLVLERAWGMLGCSLVDYKIEFGIDSAGALLISDVIDADSWRLKNPAGEEMSKQIFRDNRPTSELAEKYQMAASLVGRFRIPKQAVVFWRGSDNDGLPKDLNMPAGVNTVDIVCSAHKSPGAALCRLEETLDQYPDGGVIIPLVGMSNGLGPILSARTSWPVLGVCVSAKDNPNDVWSNLRLPSNVPMATFLSVENAVLHALNILSATNPAAYMQRQFDIEKLDP